VNTNAKDFQKQMRAYKTALQKNLDRVSRAVSTKLFTAIIKDSPVLSGRFRTNWITSSGVARDTTLHMTSEPSRDRRGQVLATFDPGGNDALDQMRETVDKHKWKNANPVFFANNLPYAERLEYGYSKKAPQGMVRKNIARFNTLIEVEVGKAFRKEGLYE
jgi:hypothetical protein